MIHKNAVGKTDPHRLSPVRGPSSELEAHIDSCSFDELPEYAAKVRSIKKEPYFAVDLFSGAGGLSLGLHRSNFDVILACDIRNDSIMTHRHHFGGWQDIFSSMMLNPLNTQHLLPLINLDVFLE